VIVKINDLRYGENLFDYESAEAWLGFRCICDVRIEN
jgi:hypothetical protein